MKKKADYIAGELWAEFVLLREVYRTAAAQDKGLLLLIGYQGDVDEDD